MTLICPVLNLISLFQNVLQKHSTAKHRKSRLNELPVFFSFSFFFFIQATLYPDKQLNRLNWAHVSVELWLFIMVHLVNNRM